MHCMSQPRNRNALARDVDANRTHLLRPHALDPNRILLAIETEQFLLRKHGKNCSPVTDA
jgi:hypothetical protein